MTTFNFPTAPATDAIYSYLGKTWKYNGTGWVPVPKSIVNIAVGRETLTADRTYYVATTGNDSNNGLTIGTPFLTAQKAIDVILATLDVAGYQVTIQIADGTYTTPMVVGKRLVGGGYILIQGNAATPSNVLCSYLYATEGAEVYIKDLKLDLAGQAFCLYAYMLARITFANIVFGQCVYAHMRASYGSTIAIAGNYSIITNTAQAHYEALATGVIKGDSRTVTSTGTSNYSVGFAHTEVSAAIEIFGMTYSGTVTGKRYHAALNGAIQTYGAGANFFPGTIAGIVALGGQYN